MHSCLVVTKKCHRETTWKIQISKKTFEPYHFTSSKCHSTIFSFDTRTGNNMLFFAMPRDKIITNKCTITTSRFSFKCISSPIRTAITNYSCMTILGKDNSTPNRPFKISQDTLDNAQMKQCRCMHKLANKTNNISDVRSSDSKINKLTHQPLIVIDSL